MKLIGSFWLIYALFPITQTPDFSIAFSKIDNRVYAFVNDELVFDSQFIDGNPELNLSLDLNPFLKKGTNVIKIQLENGSILNAFIVDTHWTIRYEIFENAESYDYGYESSKNGKTGLIVYEKEHNIYLE
jgi:hypothetical protein